MVSRMVTVASVLIADSLLRFARYQLIYGIANSVTDISFFFFFRESELGGVESFWLPLETLPGKFSENSQKIFFTSAFSTCCC
jgi:hypothetical protein